MRARQGTRFGLAGLGVNNLSFLPTNMQTCTNPRASLADALGPPVKIGFLKIGLPQAKGLPVALWPKRFCFLSRHSLHVFRSPRDFEPLLVVSLRGVHVDLLADRKFTIVMSCAGEGIVRHLVAHDEYDFNSWFRALEQTIENLDRGALPPKLPPRSTIVVPSAPTPTPTTMPTAESMAEPTPMPSTSTTTTTADLDIAFQLSANQQLNNLLNEELARMCEDHAALAAELDLVRKENTTLKQTLETTQSERAMLAKEVKRLRKALQEQQQAQNGNTDNRSDDETNKHTTQHKDSLPQPPPPNAQGSRVLVADFL